MSIDYEEELRREKSQHVRPAASMKSKRPRWIAAVFVAAMLLAVGAWLLSDASPAASTPPAFKGGDGTFRAAVDACEVCYEARRGYEQAGDKMVCRKCRLGFPSEVIDDTSGGCHPIRVEQVVEGDALVVRPADLEQTTSKYAVARQPGRR